MTPRRPLPATVTRAAAGAALTLGALSIGTIACSAEKTTGTPSSAAPTTGTPSSAAGATGGTAGGATGTTLAVQRDVLGEMADPPGATGRTLSLVRYTIAPGAKLAPHIHPGVQMARIETGTLSYTIEEGTAVIRRAGASADEQVTGPTTTTLGPGDTVQEVAGMVHFGANATDQPIVIIASLLTETGEGLSVTVTTPAP